MNRATFRSSWPVLSAIFLAFLMLGAVRPAAAQSDKALSQKEVIELLEGGVASERVSSIVDERGIDFSFTSEIEQKIRDAGGGDDLVAALKRASQRRVSTEGPTTGGLIIKTTPGESQIYLNDEPRGMTSPEGEIRLPDLQPGSYKVRVSLPGYQSFEQIMQVSAGEPQTVYVTLVQKSAVTPPPVINNPVQQPRQSASDGLPIPGVKVSRLQFFEGPHDLTLQKSQRVYRYAFDRATTRSVFWELDLGFPFPSQRIDFQLEAIWYKPDGSELRHQTLQAYVTPEWRSSWHALGFGWTDAGHWLPGNYRVEILCKGTRIASGSFSIN